MNPNIEYQPFEITKYSQRGQPLKNMSKNFIYLNNAICSQNWEKRYSIEDHKTWSQCFERILLSSYRNAHPWVLKGLFELDLPLDQIPKIEDINKKLSHVGWKAESVSGFISPIAFFEALKNKTLPIAVEIRKPENQNYSPSPDIIHEVIGHACLLFNKDYSRFLQKIGSIGLKCIVSTQESNKFKILTDLCTLREEPLKNSEEIKFLENQLIKINKEIDPFYISTYEKISRFFWWTVEMGIIIHANKPKVYGAALISSPHEASQSIYKLQNKLQMLNVDCIKSSFDPSLEQTQFYYIKDFSDLNEVFQEIQFNTNKECYYGS